MSHLSSLIRTLADLLGTLLPGRPTPQPIPVRVRPRQGPRQR